MIAYFYSIDTSVLLFCNRTLANPFFDVLMPLLTDWNKHWYGWVFFVSLWLSLFVFGGKKGRILALLVILVIAIADQFSSTFVKNFVLRSRPCWNDDNGLPIIPALRHLIDCGGGYSFPSSHAVNNFAAATFLSYYYRKWAPALFGFAALIAFTRLYLGVHYPSDVLGGACIGTAISFLCIASWNALSKKYPKLAIPMEVLP